MSYSISAINQLDQAEFIDVLGSVFEDTPDIAAVAWLQHPFVDKLALEDAMVEVMRLLLPSEQLTLIRAHPDLGSKAKMAVASVQEQSSVGLDQLLPNEFEMFQQLNQAYKEKFDFPFIVAVKHHTKDSILAEFQRRLNHSPEVEKATALEQIAEIARLRIAQLVE